MAVRDALNGQLGEDGVALAQLFRESADRGQQEKRRADKLEREANALAAVLADILDGQAVDDVANDLPHDARLRVLAYRHQHGLGRIGARPSSQFGRLPTVPPRASVMRKRERVIDVDVVVADDDPARVMSPAPLQRGTHPQEAP